MRDTAGIYVKEANEGLVDTGKAFGDISEESAASTEEVSASVEEQSSTIEDISSTAENLRVVAERLTQSVNGF